jgi:hypothetical protein
MNVMTMELSPGTVISAQLALVCDAEAPVEILPLDGRHDDQVLSILSSGRTFFLPDYMAKAPVTSEKNSDAQVLAKFK